MFSEKSLHCYGTSLPLLELDQVPSKKPLYVQNQIATDEQGRRRFHGAFTGGFSAGYWNTVGSKEGWTPAQFKSSRTEKAAERFKQRPEDFMDEEDKGVFGIAPKGLKINEDYTVVEQEAKRKRKLPTGQEAIPGEPVLNHLIKPIKDNVSVRILKTWGWRPGQGIGPRQSRQEKKKNEERNKRELYLIENYGCELPNTSGSKSAHSDESDTEDYGDMDDITFAPEDYDMPPCSIKQNRYSLGYKSLNRTPVLRDAKFEETNDRFNLFQPLEMLDKSNQRISFTGQAFGVGALEDDDDEDIFAKDDMTRYDFTLEEKKEMKRKSLPQSVDKQEVILGEFLLNRNLEKLRIYTVEMPFGWQPRNWLKKRNRFEPLEPHRAKQLEKKFEQMNQQQELSRKQRADALGEKMTPNTKPSLQAMQDMYKERQKKTKDLLEKISSKSQNFTKGGIITEQGEEQAIVESEDNESSSSFKPFLNDAHKQNRYDQFLQSQLLVEEDIEELLNKIQPKEMSFWDKRTELKEFIQARKLYQPLKGTIADRFITEAAIKKENKVGEKQIKENTTEVKLERLTKMWKPQALLCKRYNIPEPYGGHMKEELQPKKRKKISVFDYLETSVNKKEDFRTPQIFTKFNTEEQQKQQQAIVEEIKCKEESLPFIETNQLAKNNNKLIKGFVAKTNLEKQVIESLDKPAPEKKELFKAIFSDDEEEEEKIVRDEDNHKTLLAPSINVTAAAANLLRNNSPPRGIFKALFSFDPATPNPEIKDKKIEQQKQQSDNERSSKQERITFQPRGNKQQNGNENDIKVMDIDTEMYGPALPIKTVQMSASIKYTSVNIKTHQTNQKEKEIWVEKSIIDRDQDSNSTLSSNDELSSSSKREKYKLKKSKKTKHNKKSHRKLKKHGKKHKKSKK